MLELILACCALGSVRPMVELVSQQADRVGVPEVLLQAIVQVESSYRPKVVNTDAEPSYGLGQITADTAWHRCRMTADKLLDPARNALCAAKILKQHLVKYGGDWALAASAYNAGHAIKSNTEYVDKVMEQVRAMTLLVVLR